MGATPALAQACVASTSVNLAGETVGGTGVTFDESTNCAAIRSGLYETGTDTAANFPVSGNGGNFTFAGDAGVFHTSKATYKVALGGAGVNPSTGYADSYVVSILSLIPGEVGGTDSFTMFYAAGSDAATGTYGNATTPFTVNITNLQANLAAPTISASFSPTSITSASGSSATLTLTINNPNASVQLTGVAVAASALPAGLTGSSPGTTCSGGTATLVANSLSLSGATLNASASCAVTLTVSSGTPNTYSYTTGAVSATGPGSVTGTTATTATSLSVIGPTATQTVAAKILTQNQPATNFTPVTGSGGTPPLGYSINQVLPTGLSFNTSTGAITGSPTASSGATTYTVTVTDANTAAASNTFSLTVNTAVTATQSIPSVALTQNHAASVTPVTGSGGTGSLSYSVSPPLPAGLSLNGSTGAITGTPTTTGGASSYTVTVTDTNSATASSTFTLAVNSAVTATQSVASKTLTQNQPSTTFTPVTGGSGTGTLSYGVAPALPAGLTLNSSTGTITGTPTASIGASTFTVTVTDSNSATASNTFSLTVNSAVAANPSVASATVTVNTAITPFTPVTGSGGTTPRTFSIDQSLPTGLSFNTGTGQITGTATVTSATTTYTVTVTDANAATASSTFQLTVNGPVTATQAIASVALTQNHAVSSFTPVTGSGGTPPLAYSILPALPAGLSLNTSTGAITGTPTATSGANTYTVTVTDANSASSNATFSLAVNPVVTATQSVASANVPTNIAITPFTPVTGGGGTSPLSYAISPVLPAGLTFSTANGQVSGTPTATIVTTTYTVTVTDSNNGTASNTFQLTVNNGPLIATQTVALKALTRNAAAPPFTPVTGSGGVPVLTYGIAPALPTGLVFNTSSGQITGTPTVTSGATTYTVTVTDANTATASNTFSLSVNGALTATQIVSSTILTANQAAPPFTPVTGGGGTAPLAYSITSPSLPAGLTINSASGQITGTPTAALATTTFTVTVTDANSATATNTFSLTVNAAVTATTAVPSTALPINQAVTPFTPVAGAGGTGTLTYAISPALPTGLSFNTSNGVVSGTPTVQQPPTTFTVTVTDTNSASASSTFSVSVGQIQSSVSLTSSQNPSQFGQPVTFTASVTGAGGTPAGTVTFNDNGAAIGSSTLAAGVATFTTSTLAVGSHTITASYGGSALYTPSNSSGLAQTVNVPVDSVRLRALQLNVTKMVAQSSGQAISGAIDDAIADGFGDGGPFLAPGAGRMRFNFSADPRDDDGSAAATAAHSGSNAFANGSGSPDGGGRAARGRGSRVNDAFAALDQPPPSKAVPKWHEEKEWLLWADVRGTGVDRWSTSTANGVTQASQASLYGQQLNALMGLTYRATPSFIIGALGGYETFSYTQQDINGRLKGDGWTVGSYLGWKISPTLRFDAAVAYSGIGYDGTAGTAQGNFTGQRWLASTGLTGTYKAYGFLFEPSAKVYALWEHENAYVDSLGTRQGTHDFATGRASGGLRTAYPIPWLDSGILLTPYVGAYGDYYFTKEEAEVLVGAANTAALASTPLLQGWSARLTGGVGARLPGGAGLGFGAEFGGLGGNTHVWTFSAKARVPFDAQ